MGFQDYIGKNWVWVPWHWQGGVQGGLCEERLERPVLAIASSSCLQLTILRAQLSPAAKGVASCRKYA